MKNDGVPVLANVAAILRQINPDLPTPVTTTLPRQPRSSSTARTKLSSRRSTIERIPLDSTRSTSAARLRSSADFTLLIYLGQFIDSFDGLEQSLEFI